jgi:hypothetical protein
MRYVYNIVLQQDVEKNAVLSVLCVILYEPAYKQLTSFCDSERRSFSQ